MTITTDVTATVETITPELAAQYLGANTRNRHINVRTVARYAHDMTNGQWQMAGEPIKFAADGTLLDGQHRLRAVIASTITVPMMVVRGLAPESQHVMDSGRPRGLAGQLQISGHPNAVRLASTARLSYTYERGLLFTDRARDETSISDLLAFIDLNPDLADAILLLPNQYRTKIDANPAVICTFLWITRRIDVVASERFMHQAVTKTNLPPGSPILALDSRLRELSRTRTILTAPAGLSMFIRVWNAWRQDKPMGRVQTHRDGAIVRFEAVL